MSARSSTAAADQPSRNSDDISQLLAREDWQALMERLERYRPQLRRIAEDLNLPMLNGREDASDVVQDTLYDAVRGLPSVQAKSSPQLMSWLHALLHNRILATRRKYLDTAKRDLRREVYLQQPSRIGDAPCVDRQKLPEQILVELELLEKLQRATQGLPDELKLLLKWRYDDGLTYEEIGGRIERSPDAVRMLIHRCLRRLKKQHFGDTRAST